MLKSNRFEEVLVQSSRLSVEERAALELALIESLDKEQRITSNDWYVAGLAECERRLDAYESGEDRRVALDHALQRARSQLR